MIWRLLEMDFKSVAAHSGAVNMAVDAAILAEVDAGLSPPTFRLYGWSKPCISLGHSQNPERELNLDRVRELGYDIVMRPTGGRAVLHIGELTYSLLARAESADWAKTQESSYRAISQAIAVALSTNGLGISLDRGYPVEKPLDLRAMTPCFSSTARAEVVYGNRKVVGSAQRRLRNAFLQHGSILVSSQHRTIVECLRLDAHRRTGYLEILDRNAVSLEEVLNQPIRWESVAEGFSDRFATALGIVLERAPMTASEAERVSKSMPEWYGNTPVTGERTDA